MFGTMAENMKVSIWMTKNMVLECTPGLMVAAMKDTGSVVSNMELVLMWFLKSIRLNMGFGKMESVLNGLMKKKFKILMHAHMTTLTALASLIVRNRWK